MLMKLTVETTSAANRKQVERFMLDTGLAQNCNHDTGRIVGDYVDYFSESAEGPDQVTALRALREIAGVTGLSLRS